VRSHIIEIAHHRQHQRAADTPAADRRYDRLVGLETDGRNAAPQFRKIPGIGAAGKRLVAGAGEHRGLLDGRALEILKSRLQQQRGLGADRVAAFRPVDRDQRGAVGVVLDQDFLHGCSPKSGCRFVDPDYACLL
jgi:hypothetical protein